MKKMKAPARVEKVIIIDALNLIMPDKDVVMDQVETLFEEEGYKAPSWKEVKKVLKTFKIT